MTTEKKRILFTGYAPIHFVCFLPVYRLISEDPGMEVFLSGGFKKASKKDGVEEATYCLEGFYDGFPVDRARVIPMERVREEHFDVLVSAHTSDTLFPKSVNRTVQIFHGVSFKNLSVREKALRFDILCLPGRYHAELYRKNGFVREGGPECLLTGLAKTDPLVTGALERDALLRGLGMDPALKTLLFAPTGEKHNALDTMGHEVVRALCANGGWNLLVKPHDHPKKEIDWFGELAPYEGGKMRLVRDKDVVPYLNAADLLITDASSVAVEYTLLDRPIIFLDVPKLFRRLKKRAPALDLETYGRKIGRVVKAPAGLAAAVAESLADPGACGEMRRAMASHVFFDPGNATANVAGVVRYAAGLAKAPPEGVEVLRPEGPSDTASLAVEAGAGPDG